MKKTFALCFSLLFFGLSTSFACSPDLILNAFHLPSQYAESEKVFIGKVLSKTVKISNTNFFDEWTVAVDEVFKGDSSPSEIILTATDDYNSSISSCFSNNFSSVITGGTYLFYTNSGSVNFNPVFISSDNQRVELRNELLQAKKNIDSTNPLFNAELVTKSSIILFENETVALQFKNTGTTAWYPDGELTAVYLQDSTGTPFSLEEDLVLPGNVGIFVLKLDSLETPPTLENRIVTLQQGDKKKSFSLSVENITAPENTVLFDDMLTLDDPPYNYSGSYTQSIKGVFYDGDHIEQLCDQTTFRAFSRDERYAKDKSCVYFKGQKISGAIPSSFTFMEQFDFTHDAKNTFYQASLIPDLDFSSFKEVSWNLFKDKNHVFLFDFQTKLATIFPDADPATFSSIKDSNYYTDNKYVYHGTKKLEGAKPTGFSIVDPFFIDQKSVFYYERPISDLTPSTFSRVGVSYAKDLSSVFFLGDYLKPVEDAIPATFEELGGYYGTDGVTVYYQGEIIEGADPLTFEIAGPNEYSKAFFQRFAHDKKNKYYKGVAYNEKALTARYEAAWVSQTQPKNTFSTDLNFHGKAGDVIKIEAVFSNTGTMTWVNTGSNEVTMAIYKDVKAQSGPKNSCYSNPDPTCIGLGKFGESYFFDTSWHSVYRLATLNEEVVEPGETGTFILQLKIPENAAPGIYREDITLAYGKEWMDNLTNGDPIHKAHVWVGIEVE